MERESEHPLCRERENPLAATATKAEVHVKLKMVQGTLEVDK